MIQRPAVAMLTLLLLLLLLTWLAVRGMNSEAPRYERSLAALDSFEVAEGALRRGILSARAGLLHDYDGMVRQSDALGDALRQLRQEGVDAAVLDPLVTLVQEQEELLEEFKTDNALLQNSLTYFAVLSSRYGTAERSSPLAPAVSALAAAMLQLTLDRSPGAAQEVAARLDELAAQA